MWRWGVERKILSLVKCWSYLHIASLVETIELVEQLQHSALNFFFATAACAVALRSNSIDFVHENYGWCMLVRLCIQEAQRNKKLSISVW